MRAFILAGLVFSAAVLADTSADATPFNGQTIAGVNIGGTSYNVSFSDVAFTSLPAAKQVPTFTTLPDALAALAAITARPEYTSLVNAAAPINPYTSIVVALSGATLRNAFVGDTVSVFNGVGVASPAPTAQSSNFQLDANLNYNFAGITLTTFAPAAVPEPASMAVLAVGLFGASLLRRRG